MLKTIFVPVGDTMQSMRAIHQAVALSQVASANIHLLGLVQHNEVDSIQQFSDPVTWNVTKNAKQADLHELASTLQMRNIPVEVAMLDAFTDEMFIDYMQAHDFDLIIFSEKDHVARRLIRQTLSHTSVPVYVARSEENLTHRRILVPLDGSQRAESVLSMATTLAQVMDATLVLAHVIREPDIPRRTSPDMEVVQLVKQITQRNRRESNRYLDEISERLPVPTEKHIIVHNSVTGALHDLIKQQKVDLVALCAHGYSAESNQPFGSITSNMIDYSPTSFIVLQDLPARLPAMEAMMTTGRYSGV